MRLCLRLAVLAALLAAMAIGLVHLRTGTTQAGNRLHSLYSQKRSLEKACCGLELALARLKSQDRLREHAAGLQQMQPEDLEREALGLSQPRPAPSRERPVLAHRRAPPLP